MQETKIMLLTPTQTRELFEDARTRGYAVLAVNADSPSCVRDCLEAAKIADAPILIETSLWQLTGASWGRGDARLGMALYLGYVKALAESERFAGVKVGFHTDHIKGPDAIPLLCDALTGFDSLSPSSFSIDSSAMTEEENLAAASTLCVLADALGKPFTLEMEAGVDDGLTPLAESERVVSAIEKKHPGKLALWAPGVGTRHGFSAGGFPEFSTATIEQHAEMLRRVCGRPVGIALHGSSGLSDDDLKRGVEAGVAKVNWSTESLQLRSAAARDFYAKHAETLMPGAPGFKDAAMDNGLQAAISAAYIPKVVEKIQALR
jgi:fructose-bisphosphate aldolase, class II